MPEDNDLVQDSLNNDEEIDFNIPEDVNRVDFSDTDFEEALEQDDLSELEGNFDGYEGPVVENGAEKKEDGFQGIDPEGYRDDDLNHTILEGNDPVAEASDPRVKLHFYDDELKDDEQLDEAERKARVAREALEEKAKKILQRDKDIDALLEDDSYLGEEPEFTYANIKLQDDGPIFDVDDEAAIDDSVKEAKVEEPINANPVLKEEDEPDEEVEDQEESVEDDYEEEDSDLYIRHHLFDRMDQEKIRQFAEEIEKQNNAGILNPGAALKKPAKKVKVEDRKIEELREDYGNHANMRDAFDTLDAEHRAKKLDGFFSVKTEEYTTMMRSYDELRKLQSTRNASAKELAEKMDELQENARKYYEKKLTESQNERKKNRMAWAKKIMEMDNKYVHPVAYEMVNNQKNVGVKLINEAFKESPISREKLSNGVARYIVFDLLDKQIAKGGSTLSYNDIQLMTERKRLEGSLTMFMQDETYKNFMKSQSDAELQNLYTVSGNASVNEDMKSAELLSERLHKKLLNHITKMEKKAENKKTASKEKTLQKMNKKEKVNSL